MKDKIRALILMNGKLSFCEDYCYKDEDCVKLLEDIWSFYELFVLYDYPIFDRIQKAMVVCSSRQIAYNLLKIFQTKYPEWFVEKKAPDGLDVSKEELKKLKPMPFMAMVASVGSNDQPDMYNYLGGVKNSARSEELDAAFKQEKSNFRIAVVVDMWITGFDVPSLTYMYNDKPLKKEYLKEIRATAIEIEPFDPIEFPWVNHFSHRDHRKIAIIDGNIGYCGGINVADYYLTGLEDVGKWRDMHARVQGEAAAELQKVFLEMWNKENGENVGGADYFPLPESAEEGSGIPCVAVKCVDIWRNTSGEGG